MIRASSSKADPNKPPQKKQTNFAGFRITIEYPAGSTRTLKNADGDVVYSKLMLYSYGYFNGTQGRDTDETDVILGTNEKCQDVYVCHMKDLGPDIDQREDEDKVCLGMSSYAEAKAAFISMYPASWLEGVSVMPVETFRKKLATAYLPHREKKIHCAGF